MKIISTLHNHCTFCDGKSTADEMIRKSIQCSFTDFGMSCHGYAPFDLKYSVASEDGYISAMAELKRKYEGQIRLWCGVEEDYFAQVSDPSAYDYIIGDVHYAKERHTGELMAVDGSPDDIAEVCSRFFGGNAMDMVRDYYANIVRATEDLRPDVIGHFDLIVKHNAGGVFFNEESDEYKHIALQALEECASFGIVFEVNSGAVVKGKRKSPYPDVFLLKRLHELGGRVTLSADCHRAENLLGGIDVSLTCLREAGFTEVQMWENGVFVPHAIDG